MRVLYFTRDYTTHDHRFLKALAESGQEVFFLPLERRGHRQEDRLLPAGVTRVQWAGGQKPARLRDGVRLLISLRKVLREIKPDVVHAGPVQTVGLLAALSGFRPLVTMSWGSDLLVDADKSKRYQRVTRYVLGKTDVLVGDCDAVRQKARAFGMPDERIVTFPWGVDLERFSLGDDDGLRERVGWQDKFVVLHVRSWEPVYGVDVFAKAFVRAAHQEPDLRLFLLGNGSQAQIVRSILMGGGVVDMVQFVGQVSQEKLPSYYRTADLYVSASHSDGSSVSLMEALASGVPSLVSDIPGNQEWIDPGVAGWRFADGDVDKLAEGIVNAVKQKKKLKKIGQAARKLAEERANWPNNFEKLLEAYEMAVAMRKKK